jgi:hypothetical protein
MAESNPHREVRADLTCRNCGYNLRGLSLDRTCPECGTPALYSARGYQLRFADPAWLGRVRRGSNTMLLAVAAQGVGIILFLLTNMSGGRRSTAVALAILVTCGGLALALWMIGVTNVTTVEPRAVGAEPPVTVRMLARTSTLIAGFSGVIWLASLTRYVEQGAAQSILGLCFAFFSFAALGTLLLHLRKLAARTLSSHLHDWITSYLITASVTVALMLVITFIAAFDGGAQMVLQYTLCVGCLLIVSIAFLCIWMILLLAEFNRELDRCVRYSESER